MKVSFSTLACPAWTLEQVITAAVRLRFDGIELRFVQNDDRLWQRPEFQGHGLQETKARMASVGLQIPCLDTSCFFHYRDAERRRESLQMGQAMVELAACLGAPAVRVFGDRVQEGVSRESTKGWIVEGLQALADFAATVGVEVWLESHGDFALSRETLDVLQEANRHNTGILWDPLNAFAEFGEDPRKGFEQLGDAVRHVHIKDARPPRDPDKDSRWEPVLMGLGNFPAAGLIGFLREAGYNRFVSFEWEKHWHPQIPEADTALPQFKEWITRVLEA